MKLIKNLRDRYASENKLIQEKAVSLLILNSMLCVGFLALAVLRLSGGSILMGSVELGVSILMVVFCAALLKGFFKTISVATILLFFFAASGLFALRDVDCAKDIYLHSTYMIPALLTLPLLAYHTAQVYGIILLALGSHTAHNFLRVIPAVRSAGAEYSSSEFAVSFLLMLFSGAFIYQIFLLQYRNLDMIQKTSDTVKKQYERLRSVLEKTTDVFNVGERLQVHASQNADAAGDIAGRLKEMQEKMRGLDESTDSTRQEQREIQRSREAVQESMEQQTNSIQNATTAVEQIGAQVDMISGSTAEKQQSVEELVQVAANASLRMTSTIQVLYSISAAADRIIEVIKVIEDIADRTNLLAMNAAIEAAHAGASGRGFAVVAGEIRNLAEETNENSRTIRSTLEENSALIGKAVSEGDELKKVFDTITGKIETVHQGLMEIIAGMDEFRTGKNEIQTSIEDLIQMNERVNTSLAEMGGHVQTGSAAVEHITGGIGEISQQIDSLARQTETILEESVQLKQMGNENIDGFQKLQDDMKALQD